MTPADGEPARSLAGEARAARHAAVLDEAALEFNRAGVAGASLAVIARRVGLSRASLYNYCADREDLVSQCYLRTCALTERDLRRASGGHGSGLDKLASFLRQALELDHAPMAVLSELAFLPADRQAPVRAARLENFAGLAALIGEGIEDGSIRSCDVDLAGQAIWGMLSWAPLSRTWTDNSDETFAIRMAAAIPGVISDGIAAEGAALPHSRPPIGQVVTRDTDSERDERLELLARTGSRLFNQRGIDGVSLDDVAAEVGATKGLVYHYFDNKPAFVAFCYERAFEIYRQILDVAETGATGLDSSFLGLVLNVEAQLEDIHPLSLTTGFDIFRADLRTRFTDQTNRLARRSVEFGRRGVKDGSLRAFDLEPVALASAGTFNYLAKWLPPTNARRADQVADEVSRLFLTGLRKPPG
jgi:AcrR family transcriptional regulator